MKRLLALMLCAVSLGVEAQTTFNVDMTCAPEFDNVFVTGPWCGWCAENGNNVMTDPDGDGVYTVVIEDLVGTLEYKYAVDGFTGQENLVNDMIYGADCAPITDNAFYANRLTEQGSTTNDFYGTCDCICNDAPPAPGGTVLFRVDMSEYGGAFGTVNLNGSFNGWCGGCAVMTDDDQDMVYELAVELPGGTIEYTFSLDGWTIQEILTNGDACTSTIDGYINRTFDVTAEDAELDAVCWNSCDACVSVPTPGCIDEQACNYSAEATEDDGSCWYDNSCVETNDGSEFLVNTIGVTDYTPELADAGYTLLYPNYQPNVYLIDMCGEVVHTWENSSDVRPGNTAYLQENGDLILTYRPQGFANDAIWACGAGAIVERRTWNNEVVWSFTLNDSTGRLHHDIEVKPDGNVFAIAWEHFSADAALAAGRDPSIVPEDGLWSEMILELAPDGNGGANVVWEWHAWDHLVQDLDPTLNNFGVVSETPRKIDINYGSPSNQPSDWLHINAVDFNPFFGHLLLSVPSFDELWIVDYNNFNSGELLWRWGNPEAYDMGTVDDKQLFYQHDCHWVFDHVSLANPDFGKIAVFNNRVPNGENDGYSAVNLVVPSYNDYDNIYAIEDGTYLPVGFDWSYVAPDSIESTSHSSFQRLENGNSLICYGRWGDVREITSEGEVAWRYKIPLSNSSGFAFPATQGDELGLDENSIFKILRYPLSFGAFDNVELLAQGPLELEPNPLGSCGGIYSGCTDLLACNYEAFATLNDGSCIFPGTPCDDGNEFTQNDTLSVSCECVGILIEIPGCTDVGACNYSTSSNVNDGSCLYYDAIGVCGGDCAEDVNADGICDSPVTCANIGAAFWQGLELGVYIPEPTPITPDSLPIEGIQLTVGDDLTEELVLNVPLVFVDEVTGGAFQVLSWSNLTAEGLPPGVELILPQDLEGGSQACVELTGDDYPTQEGFYEVVITGEVELNFFGTPFSIGDVSSSFWVEVVSNPNGVPGCTYPTASNYMLWATYDSGVCEFMGCTDPTALNYSPRHSVDDGSCFYNDPNCVAESACPEDLNGDGAVGTPDLLLMLGEYGNFCD